MVGVAVDPQCLEPQGCCEGKTGSRWANAAAPAAVRSPLRGRPWVPKKSPPPFRVRA